jgi:hypothetical protein
MTGRLLERDAEQARGRARVLSTVMIVEDVPCRSGRNRFV